MQVLYVPCLPLCKNNEKVMKDPGDGTNVPVIDRMPQAMLILLSRLGRNVNMAFF